MPIIKPFDEAIENRIKGIVNYHYEFVKDVKNKEYEKKLKDLNYIYENEYYKYSFLHLILDSFQLFIEEGNEEPENVIDFMKNTTGEMNIKTIVDENFKITDDENNIIYNNELDEFIKENGIKISVNKFKKMLIKKGAKLFRNMYKRGICNIIFI